MFVEHEWFLVRLFVVSMIQWRGMRLAGWPHIVCIPLLMKKIPSEEIHHRLGAGTILVAPFQAGIEVTHRRVWSELLPFPVMLHKKRQCP